MSNFSDRRYSVQEYFRLEAESPEKFEYWDGRVVPLSELIRSGGGGLSPLCDHGESRQRACQPVEKRETCRLDGNAHQNSPFAVLLSPRRQRRLRRTRVRSRVASNNHASQSQSPCRGALLLHRILRPRQETRKVHPHPLARTIRPDL